VSLSEGLSQSLGQSLGLTETKGTSETIGTSTTETTGTSSSLSSQTNAAKIASIGGSVAGAAIGAAGVVAAVATGPFAPLTMIVAGQVAKAAVTAFNEQQTTGTSQSTSNGRSESHSTSSSEATSRTTSDTRTTSTTDTRSLNKTGGSSRQMSIETTDKTIERLLSKIDHHLERIDEAKTYGGWNCAAYFIGDSTASSESLASIFLGLIRGSKSSHEDFALTTWQSVRKKSIIDWLTALSHPQLRPNFSKTVPISYLTPATLVSGKELAIQLSLPRRSTSTVAVLETQAFGRKVQRLDGTFADAGAGKTLTLGNIRHLWENLPQTISLNLNQLSGHVFVSGSTGAGKSNTLYEMLSQIEAAGVPFLVIEPAKGEYKHIFGQRADVSVFGTHPAHSELLRINPFKFPTAIHVLEHVDRLVEIFNVCWPMYAAMPAVLKDAILQAYEECGWDLESSANRYSDSLFPTFADLLIALESVITASAYSQELKGNYIGSLSTRIKSLTNGLNGQIFVADEIDSATLFDSNVIVDLSRVGSSETKALIMGILVMRLSEYRMAYGGMNQQLRHVTVLEEAHNILRRSAGEGGAEGAAVIGKSVEMLTNAIAEMRTYGEGFIIADQSPHAVDIAAIRNTNTKIIMRLPDEMDRRLIGKSVALRDDQLEEIARLPKGVAIVYQNDWLEPVLCQVKKFAGSETPYVYHPANKSVSSRSVFNEQVLKLLLATRIRNTAPADVNLIEAGMRSLPMLTRSKLPLYQALDESKREEPLTLWKPERFAFTAALIVDILGCRSNVQQAIQAAPDFDRLRDWLGALLSSLAHGLTAELAVATQQCLMKDYSMQKEADLKIYAAWRASVEKGSVL
ncbi:ATP-binding protein, partial [Paraburkholderia xenovorans]|uniref:ATP-binding protein n=1 Tax=Paraburkholderia xenovorans TaxID=36873 RepID=UPI0038BC35AB